MNINQLIKEAHENAVEKGFYECPECNGKGKVNCGCSEEPDIMECPECNGTGINQNKNIPEMLMLIISEISKAVEALRCGKHIFCNDFYKGVDIFEFIKNDDKQKQILLFKINIKDTFEDEIADVFIRLFDLCGYLGIEINTDEWISSVDCAKNKIEALFEILEMIIQLKDKIDCSFDLGSAIHDIFNQINYFCEHNNIDIERHIKAKMEYNKTRPKKHGKEF